MLFSLELDFGLRKAAFIERTNSYNENKTALQSTIVDICRIIHPDGT